MAQEIVAEARKMECAVDTLDGTLCYVCAQSKADDTPESIVGPGGDVSNCYNCAGRLAVASR